MPIYKRWIIGKVHYRIFEIFLISSFNDPLVIVFVKFSYVVKFYDLKSKKNTVLYKHIPYYYLEPKSNFIGKGLINEGRSCQMKIIYSNQEEETDIPIFFSH